jgi:hypothetical protein
MKFFRAILAIALLVPVFGVAQYLPGKIIRSATGSGSSILDPDGNGWVSASNAGFTINGDDTSGTASELHYYPLAAYGGEPCCDLRRGADHKFSDFVPDSKNNGVYLHWTTGATPATSYLLIRMRMGTMIPGSKGFSLLIDTDKKFGASGSNADPNYVAKTTGINGNPGYELEIVLETGFRLAIYNIDGLGQPSDGIDKQTAVSNKAFYDNNWTDRSQVSRAATNESGDPDFFLDFYVSLADLQAVKAANSTTVTSGTSFLASLVNDGTGQTVRIIPTTVMAPKPSTAGPISDIYGSTDSTTITWQPPVCLSCGHDTLCTTAPVITSTSYSGGTTTITGTWTKNSNSTSSTATITIYKNGNTTAITTTPATISVSTGNVWTCTTTALSGGDNISAKAKGSGKESNYCFSSDSIKITACNTRQNPLVITSLTNKGISGTGYSPASNHYIKVYQVTSKRLAIVGTPTSAPVDSSTVGNTSGLYSYTNASAAGNWQYSRGASGGGPSANLTPGSYMVIDSNITTGCTSGVTYYCANFSTTGGSPTNVGTDTKAPTITSPSTITTSTSTISGGFAATGTTPATMRVYLDSSLVGTVLTAGTTWSYTFPVSTVLTAGKIIRVRAQADSSVSGSQTTYYCAGDVTTTITSIPCSNSTPVIDVDSTTGQIIPGFKITGLATAGGTIKIYNSGNSLKEILTVGSDGTWSSTFNATESDNSYYVTLSTTGCSNLSTSVSKSVSTTNTPSSYCGGYILGNTYGQVSGPTGTNGTLYSDETAISGTLAGGTATANTYVKIYIDSSVVGYANVNTSDNTWGPVNVSDYLYNGAILTIGVVQSGTFGEYVCSSIRVVCSCAISRKPAKPTVDGSSVTTVSSGGNPQIVIRNPIAGNYYSVIDSTTKAKMSKGVDYTGGTVNISGRMLADSTLTITTTAITSNTTAEIVATKVGGTESCTDTTYQALRISAVLPIILTEFQGTRNDHINTIKWKTADEINFNHFELERSTDGSNYIQIAIIRSNGRNSSYEFQDNVNNQTFYYRLKMVDNDGKFKYSATIVLKDNGSSIVLNSIKPNPFRNNINISLFLNKEQDVKIMLVDMAGRIVGTSVQHGIQGNNLFDLNSLGQVSPGLYSLKIIANGSSYQEKMVKSAY